MTVSAAFDDYSFFVVFSQVPPVPLTGAEFECRAFPLLLAFHAVNNSQSAALTALQVVTAVAVAVLFLAHCLTVLI